MVSPLLVDRSVKVARHRRRAMTRDLVAALMECRQRLVQRTRVVPILVVTNLSSVAARMALLRHKATITKDARNRVQKQS